MMPAVQELQRMAGLLDGQVSGARRMLDILQREEKALTSNDLASFEMTLEQKQQAAANIESLEQRLLELGSLDGTPLTLKNFVRFIEQSRLPPLQSRWATLQDILRQCQRQNVVNNRVVEASRTHIRQSLDILHGKVSTPEIYVASGKTQNDATGRSLAVA